MFGAARRHRIRRNHQSRHRHVQSPNRTSLPNGIIGQAYTAVLTATGGSGTYKWIRSNGQLPAGLTLDALTGTITGTPTTPGTSTITATVTDAANTSAALAAILTIQPVPTGLTGVRSITTGNSWAYAVKTDGTVWAWGYNNFGQLGNGTTTNSAVPVQVTGLTGVQNITTNGASTLALKTDGTVWAWGYNTTGQLGNGTTTNSAVPVQVTGLTGVRNITTTNIDNDLQSAFALKTDGTVWAWGYNFSGQLGNGTTTNSAVPVQVTGLTGVQNITTNGSSAYAVKPDGTGFAWGYNNSGQLGNGTTTNSNVPVQVG